MSTRSASTFRVVQAHVHLDDPHICNDDSDSLAIQAALYESLVARVDASSFAPALATDWTVSDDARTWTFALRPDVRAHDGTHLTAADVVASLERVRDPRLGGRLGTEGVYASYLEGARYRIEEHDSGESVRIELGRPIADLLDLIVDFPIVPSQAHERFATAPVGTGRYRFARASEHEVVLDRFEDHWSGTSAHEQVVFRSEPDAAARVEAVRSGRADVASALTPALAEAAEGAPNVRIVSQPASMCAVFFFALHDRDAPSPVRDVRVRRALHHATDVDAIVRTALHGRARRLSGPFTERHLAHDAQVPPYAWDQARARALLAEAGHGAGLELTVDVPTRLPDEAMEVAAMLKRQWAEVGVTLHVVPHDDRPAYADMVRAKKIHDLCCFDSGPISSYRVLVEKFHSQVRGPWWQGYASAEVDAGIERAATLPDVDARRRVLRDVYRQLHDDAPWLYLYSPDKLWLASDRHDDWRPTFQGVTTV